MADRNGGSGIGTRFRETQEEVRGIGAEIGGIAGELRVLASKEVELAQAEMMQQVQSAIRGVVFGLIAAVLTLLFVSFLLVGMMFGLNTIMPLWAAALVTAGIVFVVVMLLAALAVSQIRKLYFVPRRFINSVKEDMRWLRSRTTSNGR